MKLTCMVKKLMRRGGKKVQHSAQPLPDDNASDAPIRSADLLTVIDHHIAEGWLTCGHTTGGFEVAPRFNHPRFRPRASSA
jgi:hypothetical protein